MNTLEEAETEREADNYRAFRSGHLAWWVDDKEEGAQERFTHTFMNRERLLLIATSLNGVMLNVIALDQTGPFSEETNELWRKAPPLRPTVDAFKDSVALWWRYGSGGQVDTPLKPTDAQLTLPFP
jgi:hypothetical protein